MNFEQDPAWLLVLQQQATEKSQKQIGDDIGYSSAAVNQVLKRKYPGDLEKFEAAVRGAYMGETVHCPVLGEIPKNDCHKHQKAPLITTNRNKVRLYRACRNHCINSQL